MHGHPKLREVSETHRAGRRRVVVLRLRRSMGQSLVSLNSVLLAVGRTCNLCDSPTHNRLQLFSVNLVEEACCAIHLYVQSN